MTRNDTYDNLVYELVFTNGIKLTGTFDKIGNHLGDFDCDRELLISRHQPDVLIEIVTEYHEVNDTTPTKFEDFLTSKGL